MKQENITKGNVTIRRVLSWLLTLAMIISGFNMIPGTRLVANAAATKADLPTAAGSTLSDGKIYYVNSDTTITNSSAGGNGLIVENNATVAIHIAKGVTLTVKGGNGNGQTGGGAGIYVPATSTLIVAGEGTLNATGGNGGNGGNGEAGTDAVRTNGAYNCTTGTGGKGGYGAGGAGAAIGTAGGAGANQPTAQSSQNYKGNPITGAGGNTGLAGENSNVSGNVYILGNVKFDGTAGSAGSAGTVPGASGSPIRFLYSPYHVHIGAGGGGGTGGATNDAATIGSGAPGAGSGGNGGNGGGTAWQFDGNGCYNGYGGNGGSIGGTNGDRSNTYFSPNKAGAGGAAGAIGASGDAGTLYVGPSANVGTLNSETATGENGYGKSSALTTLTSEEQYQILSDNGLIFEKQISFYNLDESANPDSIVTATVYGEAVSNIVIPSKNGYSFAGFYTEKNGKGIKIYDAKGKIATDKDGNIADSDSTLYVYDGYWVYPDNLSLYAYWTQKYNVTLNGNVGTDEEPLGTVGTTSIAIAGGEKVNSITVPTRKSYIFDGYFSSKDSSDDEAVKVFSADGSPYLGADGDDEDTAPDGTTFIDKDGCWAYEADDTNITIYAHWLPITTITFDKNGSDAVAGTATIKVYTGEVPVIENLPTRNYYSFNGYWTENTSVTDESNSVQIFDAAGNLIPEVEGYSDAGGKWLYKENSLKLFAEWTRGNESEVSFFDDANSITPEKVLKYTFGQAPVSKVTVPSKSGYRFMGYYTVQKPDVETKEELEALTKTQNIIEYTSECIYTAEGKLYTAAYGSVGLDGFAINDYIIKDDSGNWKWNSKEDISLYAWWISREAESSLVSITISDEINKDYFEKLDNEFAYTDVNNIPNYYKGIDGEVIGDLDVPERKGYDFAGYYDSPMDGTQIFGSDAKLVSTNVKSSEYGWIVKSGKWSLEIDLAKLLFGAMEGDYTSIIDFLNSQPKLYAQWTPLKYNFIFDLNKGDGANYTINDVDISNGYPASVTIKNQKKSGQKLIGYSEEPIEVGAYTNQKLIYKASSDDPTKFDFISDSVTVRPDVDESNTITLYAVWGDAQYQVAYYDRDWATIKQDAEGHYATVDKTSVTKIGGLQDITYGQFILQSFKEIDENYVPTFKGSTNDDLFVADYYDFLGWSTKPYAKKADYEAGKQYQGGITTTSGEIVNLYAVWVIKEGMGASISYNGNGSLAEPATNIPADDEVVFESGNDSTEYVIQPRYIPTRAGYTFLGWSKSATETDPEKIYLPNETTGITVTISEDTVFYAQWKAYPVISYDANGGSFTPDAFDGEDNRNVIAVSVAPNTMAPVINPRKKDDKDAILYRTGYEFVGWTSDIAGDTKVYSGDNGTSNPTISVQDKDIVLKAKWKKITNLQSVVADADNTVYQTIQFKGTYLNEDTGIETTYQSKNVALTELSAGTYTGTVKDNEDKDVPYGTNGELTVVVNGAYSVDKLEVKIGTGEELTVYKPTKTVINRYEVDDTHPAENAPEDGIVSTTLTYEVSNITEGLNIKITGAEFKKYDINYILGIKGVSNITTPISYNASVGATLPVASDTVLTSDKYTFAGWYETEADAKAQTAGKAVTTIGTLARGAKTYYAAWNGKKYNITFHPLYGATYKPSGASEYQDLPADIENVKQEFTYGEKAALDNVTTLFKDVKGPNDVTFLGWATSEEEALKGTNAKVKFTNLQNISEDDLVIPPVAPATEPTTITDLYAVWNIENVIISFDTNGGAFSDEKVMSAQSIKYGDPASAAIEKIASNPLRKGFKFLGWSTNKAADVPATDAELAAKQYRDAVYYAVWQGTQYSLQYYKVNNSEAEADKSDIIQTENGKKIKIGYKLDKTTHVSVTKPSASAILVGWSAFKGQQDVVYSDGEEVTVNSDVKSLWPVFIDSPQHLVVYDSNNGTYGDEAPQAQECDVTGNTASAVISNVEPTRVGYNFRGWATTNTATTAEYIYDDADKGTYSYNIPVIGEVEYVHVLYAVWEPIHYTITFNTGKASEVDATYKNSEAANDTEPTRAETLPAGLVPVEGSTTSYTQTFTYDTAATFAAVQYTYPGYKFKGWAATNAEGAPVVYKDLQSIINMTTVDNTAFNVYAVWEMDTPLIVTYRANGGELPEAQQGQEEPKDPDNQLYVRIANEIDISTAKNPYIRHGYEFVGWSTVATDLAFEAPLPTENFYPENTENAFKTTNAITDDSAITLYAVWRKAAEFKVVYHLNDGIGSVPLDKNSYHMGDEHATVKIDEDKIIPSRKGYTFLGWALAANDEAAKGLTEPMFKYEIDTTDGVPAGTYKFTPASITIDEETIAMAEQAGLITEVKNVNVFHLYAVWQANKYIVNFYQGDKDAEDATKNKIGFKEFTYDDIEKTGTTSDTYKLPAVATLTFKPSDTAEEQKYVNTPGYEFDGWSFKNGGTVSFADNDSIENLVSGADDDKDIDLFVVEKASIYKVTIDDDFETIGANFLKEADPEDNEEFYNTGWGKQSVVIKDRAADDKVVDPTGNKKVAEGETAFLVKYDKALNDITIPVAPGFKFEGYYATMPDKSTPGKITEVMYYDASGNAVKNYDYPSADLVLKAKWTATKFDVIFKEDGKQIDKKAEIVFGQKFKMPNEIKGLSYKSNYEVVGWTSHVDFQYPKTTAEIDTKTDRTSPDRYVLNTEYSAVSIAKLYNNYNANVTLYPIYKTTTKYKVYFSTEDQKRVTNLPETQEVAWKDTFTVKFDDVVMRTPYREGYTFLGWSKTEGSKTAEYPYPVVETANYEIKDVTDNFTLYAVWQANTYKIAYYNGKDAENKDIKVVEENVTYPFNVINVVEEKEVVTPYTFLTADAKDAEEKPYFEGKPGYVLVGWSLDDKAETVDFALGQKLDKALATEEGDVINVYAVWSASTYNVTFNNNSENVPVAEGTMNNQVMTYDIKVALDKNQFTAEGYEFAGWALKADAVVDPATKKYVYKEADEDPAVELELIKDEENVDLDDYVGDGNTVNLYAIWTPVIKAADETVKFDKAGYDVKELFTIPVPAGEATYKLTAADGATLEDNILKVEKTGTYEITVTTAATNGITTATAKANIIVEVIQTEGIVEMHVDGTEDAETVFTHEDAQAGNIIPRVLVTKNDEKELESPVDVTAIKQTTIEYKKSTDSDSTYSSEMPKDPGTYTVRAVVEAYGDFEGFTATSNFTISDKLEAAGTVAIFVEKDEQRIESPFDFIDVANIQTEVKQTKGDAKPEDIIYQFKVQGTADGTYVEEMPTKVGKYTVRAIVPETDKYLGYTTEPVNFEIKEKKTYEAEVAITIEGEATDTVQFVDVAKITPVASLKEGTEGPDVAALDAAKKIKYEYKVADAADGTYVTKKPTTVGDYVVRATIEATDEYAEVTAEAEFSIVEKKAVTATVAITIDGEKTNTVQYVDVAKITPVVDITTGDKNANVTYEYKVKDAADGTYASKKPEDVGFYVVRATIEATAEYAEKQVEAEFAIVAKKAVTATVAITIDGEKTNTVDFVNIAKITPVVDITVGDKTADVTYEYKLQEAGDGTYTTTKPIAVGDYVVRATIAATDEYAEKKVEAEFSISKKLEADGEVATFNGDNQSSEFMEAEGLVITPKVIFTTPVAEEEVATFDKIAYTWKVSTASDSTYKSFEEEMPSEIGTYTVRAVVADTDKYVGFTATAKFKITEDPDKAEAAAKAAAIKSAEEDVLKRLQDTYETLKSSNKYSEGELAALEAAYNQSVKDIKAAIDDIANDGTVTKSTEVPEKAEALLKAAKEDLHSAVDAQSKKEAADKAVADALANADTVLAAAEDALKNENAIQDDKDKVTAAKQTVEAAKETAEAAETNEAKNEAAKALQDAVDALDSAVDESNLHAAIAEAVMNQENIQPFVKKVATDSLKEYAERVKPDDLNEEEATAFNTALETGKAAIEAAANNEEILGTDEQPGILAQQKDAVKAAADAINETRAANAAKDAAAARAEAAETAAEAAKANEYASEEDKNAIDGAKETLADAKEDLADAETNEAKNAAAKAVEEAAKALEDATDTANANSAAAKAKADADAAAKAAAEKALADAKTEAKKAIEALYDAKNLSDYREAQQKELADAKDAGDKAIDKAETTDEVATELAAAKKAINAVKTDSAKTKEEDAAKKKADAAAAKAATEKINAIGTPVTENSKGAIDAARAAYNALTADQKKLVSNNVVKKLTDAEATYNALVNPQTPVDSGKLTVNNATGTASNGSIEGVDSTVEYSVDGGKTWTDVSGTTITGLKAGKVQLRTKANAQHSASKAITVTIKKLNPEKPNFYSLLLHQHQVKKTSTILTWTKVAGAKKYVVYGGKYGAKMKKITSTTKNKVTRKGLQAGTMYNFYVVAIDAQGLRICTSDTVYIATKGGKLTNHKKITTSVSGKSTTISVGGTLNLNAKVTKESSKLQIKKINGLKYASTNPSIAKVSTKGVITGVKKGTCYVYVYAQNGVYKKIKVTVQ